MFKKNQLNRLEKVIEKDRIGGGNNFEGLIKSDLKTLLSDYFVLNSEISLNLQKNNKDYQVKIEFSAERLKAFGVLPK